LDEIPSYLSNITGGRVLPEAVVDEIRHRYSLIGSSPLTRWTIEQARLLEEQLGIPVYVGMRNWKPYIADTVRRMLSDGVRSAVAICLAPQNSRTSVGLYRRAAYAAAGDGMKLEFIEAWAGHPLLARAFAERLKPVWHDASRRAGRAVPVIFTAHSVPCRTILAAQPESAERAPAAATQSPDPYAIEAKGTAANVAELLACEGLSARDWYFAFQSQGMSGGPWLGPTVEDTLTALAKEGHSLAVIQPIGFLCDHVEILYDIDIGFLKFAAKINLEIVRPPSLNDSPLLIEALAELAQSGLDRLHRRASAETISSAK
jgi:ferrochelatase